MYDLIGDIHGHADELVQLLETLGYQKAHGVYDPFRKVYIYGDEESAAEDMAFILFRVWRFPVDWRFFVKAAAFGDKKTDWELGTPIE